MTDSDLKFPQPVDLSPLDPTRDAGAMDARVRAIMSDAVIRPRGDLYTHLGGWLTPTLVAASIIIAVASISIARYGGATRPGSTAESLGIPRTLIELARSEPSPGIVQLSEALDVERSYVR